MNNPRLAIRYAKSLIDQARETDQLDEVYSDIKLLESICRANPDFVALLDSPVIQEHQKNEIIESITTGKVSVLTATFIKLLAKKSRESSLWEIIDAYIKQYQEIREIHNVKITTATALSDELRDLFIKKIKESNNISNIELETKVDEKLVGGFILEMEGKLVDASIQADLKDVRKQFQSNEYIHRLR